MSWPRNGTTALAANAAGAAPGTWNAGSMSGAVLAGDVLIAAVTNVASGVPSDVTGITDSLSNAWTEVTALRATTANDGGFQSKLSFWVAISSAGTPSSITVSGLTTSSGQGIAVQAHTPSVAVTAPASTGLTFEATAVATGNSTGPDSGTSAGTTTSTDGLKVGMYSDDGSGTVSLTAGTSDSAYSLGAANVNNTNAETVLEYINATVSGATARANWGTLGAATFWAAGVVVIKKAAAGGLTLALTGVAATAAVGSVVPSASVPMTGVAATGSVGTIAPRSTIPVTGNAGTTSVGTLAPSRTVALTGIAGTGAVGTVVAQIGSNLTLSLSGVSASGAVGLIVATVPSTQKWAVIEAEPTPVEAGALSGIRVPIPISGVAIPIGPTYATEALALAAAVALGTDRAPKFGPPLAVVKV